MDSTVEELLKHINENGERARTIAREYKLNYNYIRRMLRETQAVMRCTLGYSINLTVQQIQRCCETLLANKTTLLPIVQGLDLVISDGFNILADGRYEIAWNFTPN